MSDADTAQPSATDEHHDHATGDGHGHAGEVLGPVDMTTWGYAIAGSVVGLVVALALFVARAG